MSKLSDEDVERIAEALARKIVQRPAYVVPAIEWPAQPVWSPPPVYNPYVVTCGSTTTTQAGTLFN